MRAICVLQLFFAIINHSAFSQSTRGVVEEASVAPSPKGNTYAVVIGISDYPDLQPLQFADKDALLFYDFLRSPAGGEVPAQNIKLLLNEEATAGGIMTRGISWIQNIVKPAPGDRVYLYFAGHGDAVDASEAYLLAYDANPGGDKNNYSVSGTLNIQILKNRIRKLTQSGVEVVFIVDACRTADIPGGVEGLKGNYQSILEDPSGDIMLLSASPNEVSLEDKSVGQGHGLFTWELINGLGGAADEDGDQKISLFEIETYVKAKVRATSKKLGRLQNPVVCCSHQTETILSQSNPTWLSTIQNQLPQGADDFAQRVANARGGNDLFSFPNEEVKKAYFQIKKYCGMHSQIGYEVADSLYNIIALKYNLKDIQFLTEFYAGELLDECQRALNLQLENTPKILGNFNECDYYHVHDEYFKKYFELNATKAISDEMKMKKTLIHALRIKDPKSKLFVHILNGKSTIYYSWDGLNIIASPDTVFNFLCSSIFSNLQNSHSSAVGYYCAALILDGRRDVTGLYDLNDSIQVYLTQSIRLAPNWSRPYKFLSWEFLIKGDTIKSIEYAEYALKYSKSPEKVLSMAQFLASIGHYDDAFHQLSKGLSSTTENKLKEKYLKTLFSLHIQLHNCDSALYYFLEFTKFLAKKPHQYPWDIFDLIDCLYVSNIKCPEELLNLLFSNPTWAFNNAAYFTARLKLVAELNPSAVNKERFQLHFSNLNDSDKIEFYLTMDEIYQRARKYKEAEDALLQINDLSSPDKHAIYKLFLLHKNLEEVEKAKKYLDQLILLDSLNARHFIEYAMIYGKEGNLLEAKKATDKAAQLADRGDYFYRIAKLYKKMGDEEKYLEFTTKATDVGFNEKRDRYNREIFKEDSMVMVFGPDCP
jgi:tetratricopeptide (TPR) repeat protein